MIPINWAAAIFTVIVGVMLTACVILCIQAQLLFQRCLRILDFVLDSLNQQEDLRHEGTE